MDAARVISVVHLYLQILNILLSNIKYGMILGFYLPMKFLFLCELTVSLDVQVGVLSYGHLLAPVTTTMGLNK